MIKNLLRGFFCALLFTLYPTEPFAQKVENSFQAGWYQAFVHVKWGKRYFSQVDAAYRLYEMVMSPQLYSFRGVVGVQLSKNFSIAQGYAHFASISPDAYRNGVYDRFAPEHRSHQQFQLNSSEGIFSLQNRLRAEQRFFYSSATNALQSFVLRLRYQYLVSVPLVGTKMGPKTPYVMFGDELFIHFGQKIVRNMFDHNRLLAGVGYQISDPWNVYVQYIYMYFQREAGNVYEHGHTVRIALIYNIDLNK